MFKKDIAKNVSERTGIDVGDIKLVMSLIFDEISKGVGKGEDVVLRDFGTFKIRKVKTSLYHNVTLKQMVVKPECLKMKFIPGQSMTKLLKKTNEK